MNDSTSLYARRRVLAVSAAFPAALLAACGQAATPNTGTSSAAKKELVVAPPLTQLDQLVATINRAAPLADFLKKEAGTDVKAY
ncbi:MAG TPA: hypothetical protein VGW38_04195, partial [Chloroflexota bacterium]|nr:hypothetical protein [Chloroflexota bacterium]